ncbi:MAG: M23 family metallopeptidase [Bacteroides sp.]|nr:M23 family metallopeptidase [Bacteroides sp.]
MCNSVNISDDLKQPCSQTEVVAIELTETSEPLEVTQIEWLNKAEASATGYLVKAKAIIKLATENVPNGTNIQIAVREVGGEEDLQTFSVKVTNCMGKTDPFDILADWKDKDLTVVVTDDIVKPDSCPEVHIEAQFGDPLENMQIRYNKASHLFGKVRNSSTKNHQGFDYYAADGTDIYAVSNGKVDRIVDPAEGDYGKQLVVKIDNSTYYAFYAHLSEIDVAVGDTVNKGDVLGQSGITGNASSYTGNDQHLHFECRTASKPGTGMTGRENPNNIVATKFYSQDESKTNQAAVGVKKVDADNNETLMAVF